MYIQTSVASALLTKFPGVVYVDFVVYGLVGCSCVQAGAGLTAYVKQSNLFY
jgi:hypothetical protein